MSEIEEMIMLRGADGWQQAQQAGLPECVCAYAAAIIALMGLLKLALVVHGRDGLP
jgi:hypothetical protein